MIVTFDSNIWRKIASPENFPKDPEFQINKRLNTLIVVYTERENRNRIISARRGLKAEANKAERRSYTGNYQIDGKGWSKAN